MMTLTFVNIVHHPCLVDYQSTKFVFINEN